MRIIKLNKNNKLQVVKEAIKTLQDGGILIYPTETTYGLGVDAKNEEALKKLFRYKRRREGKPLSVAVSNSKMAEEYVYSNKTSRDLYKNFLPGPLTVISKGKHLLGKGVESETGTLGIRIPKYNLILEIVKEFGSPITATSANASYKKRPYKIDDILLNLSNSQKSLIDLIIDAGELPHNDPSTIVDTTLDQYNILRQGEIELTEFDTRITNSEDETMEFAGELLAKYAKYINKKPLIFALQADMGAGKTQFAKGIAQNLNIKKIISSPTFLLEKTYPFEYEDSKNTFIHIDTWRMMSKEEFEELDIKKNIEENNIIVIEWADKVYTELKKYKDIAIIIWLKIKIDTDNKRTIIYSDKLI